MRNYSIYTDDELLSLLKNNDEKAFTVIFERYWQPLFEKAYTILRDWSLAKDIVQEVFISIWKRRESLEIRNLKAYLAQATKFRVLSEIRKFKTDRELQKRLSIIATDILEDNTIIFREHKELLEKLIAKLPDNCREAFRLSRSEDLSYKEIANLLKITERSVEYKISEALKFLRTNFPYQVVLIALISVFKDIKI